MAVFCNVDDQSIMFGIWFMLAGLGLRIWANGYAIKTAKLTTAGPYAFVRNPLYLGSALVGVGFVIMLHLSYIGALFLVVMAAVYYRKIKQEEVLLERKFKQEYSDYKQHVPAIIPTLFPYRQGEKWPFCFSRLIKSHEYKLFFWMIIVVIAFYIKGKIWIEHESIDATMIVLIVIACLFAITDGISELVKLSRKIAKNNVRVS
jgi:hypothetical protein